MGESVAEERCPCCLCWPSGGLRLAASGRAELGWPLRHADVECLNALLDGLEDDENDGRDDWKYAEADCDEGDWDEENAC